MLFFIFYTILNTVLYNFVIHIKSLIHLINLCQPACLYYIISTFFGKLVHQLLVMMPLWIRVLGSSLVHAVSPNVEVVVPYGKIVASLVSLILPLLIGLLVGRFRPNWANVAKKLGCCSANFHAFKFYH